MMAGLYIRKARLDGANFESIYRCGKALVEMEPWATYLETVDLFYIASSIVEKIGISTEKDEAVSASALLTKQQFDSLRSAIFDYLASIPREYDLWVRLPSMPKWGDGEIALSNRISLVESAEPALNNRSKISLALLSEIHSLTGPTVFLKVSSLGYGRAGNSSTAVSDALSHLKQFLQLFQRGGTYKHDVITASEATQRGKASAVLIDRAFPDEKISVQIPESVGAFLTSMRINEEKLTWPDENKKTLLHWKMRPAKSREEKSSVLLEDISWIADLLDCSDKWPDAERIKTALEWAFDSEQSGNQTLGFIQACVGLEALLGDDDQEEPLTTRLADRCAYLLGKTHADRTSIRKRFKAMYAVRSKLIHGRTPRLTHSDAEHLFFAQITLSEVVTAEMRSLLAALKKNPKANETKSPTAAESKS